MTAILTIGSNCGDREEFLAKSLEYLGKICKIITSSSIYESPDYLGSGSKYLNSVVMIETDLEESSLNNYLKIIERECGRNDETRRRGEVPADIDIVIWNGEVRKPKDFCSTYFKRGFGEVCETNK